MARFLTVANMQQLADSLATVLGEHMDDNDELHVTYNAMQNGSQHHPGKPGPLLRHDPRTELSFGSSALFVRCTTAFGVAARTRSTTDAQLTTRAAAGGCLLVATKHRGVAERCFPAERNQLVADYRISRSPAHGLSDAQTRERTQPSRPHCISRPARGRQTATRSRREPQRTLLRSLSSARGGRTSSSESLAHAARRCSQSWVHTEIADARL